MMGGGSRTHWIGNVIYLFLEELFYLSVLKLLCGAEKETEELFMKYTPWLVIGLEGNGIRD